MLNIFTVFLNIVLVYSIGEKAFRECQKYGHSMLECHNVLHPSSRVRVPVDLLLYPHMVLIGFGETQKPAWKCGGSLISSRWVLTAAHCKADPLVGEATVLRVGTATFEFDEVDELEQERRVSEIIIHPHYKPPSKYHDIALIKADKPFILTRDIRIACLNLDEESNHGKLTVIGFGVTKAGDASGSQTLMKVEVDIVDNAICNKTFRYMIKRKQLAQGINDDQICAGDYENGGRDTCQGDSGGPLQVMVDRIDCVKSFPLHKLVGITSFGRDCGRKFSPGVYVKVSRYIGWIEGIVWPGNHTHK